MIPGHRLIYKILGYGSLFIFQLIVLLEVIFFVCLYCNGIYLLITYPIVLSSSNGMLLITSTLFISIVSVIVEQLLYLFKGDILQLSKFSRLKVLFALFGFMLLCLYMFSELMTMFFVTRGGCGNYRMAIGEELFTVTTSLVVSVGFITFYLKTRTKKVGVSY